MHESAPTLLRRASTERGDTSHLPPELLTSARQRLATFALVMASVFLGISVLTHLAPWDIARDVPGWEGTVLELRLGVATVQLFAVALHVLMFWIARTPRFAARTALTIGLVYEVLLCLIITVGDQWLSFSRDGRYQDLTMAALIIVVYPLFIPSRPRRTLYSAIASAAMLPFGLWILGRLDQSPEFGDYFVAVVMGVMCVAIAFAGSRVIHGLHRAVAEARQLGSYQLETLLGRGGMGEVWRGRHRLLARPAAVKVVRPEMLGAHDAGEAALVLRRFEREAQTTATMCSPHTVELYDFGVADDGTFFYVMELLDGLDLAALVRDFGPVPSARVAHFLLQICDSLGEAHARGLIHRDIKPANLYLCRYGRKVDFIKVLDFGLVKVSRDAGDPGQTREQAVGGTPAFMSPEQVLGNRELDGRTDIYAVGCVAYWLLTGRLVFEGNTPMETMVRHVDTVPAPPSHVSELPVPPAMDALVLACLEKDPSRRPQSADELASRLERDHLADGWTSEQATRWWSLHLPGPGPAAGPTK